MLPCRRRWPLSSWPPSRWTTATRGSSAQRLLEDLVALSRWRSSCSWLAQMPLRLVLTNVKCEKSWNCTLVQKKLKFFENFCISQKNYLLCCFTRFQEVSRSGSIFKCWPQFSGQLWTESTLEQAGWEDQAGSNLWHEQVCHFLNIHFFQVMPIGYYW